MSVHLVESTSRPPPHDVKAEQSVLGAVFIKPLVFSEVAAALEVDDFFMPAHREIFAAMRAVDQRRQPLDAVSVPDELRTRGMLPRLEGGEGYLLVLAGAVPTAENVAHYVRLVKEKAILRRLIATCAEVQARALGDFGDFDEFVRGAADQLNGVSRAAPAARILTPAERALTLGSAGPPLATRIATLDRLARGGFRTGGVVVVGGAPGAGKTTLVVQWARGWAEAGIPVAILAADEPASGLLIRLGQGLGCDRSALEMGEPAERERLAAELRSIGSLALVDGDEDRATVEDVAALLRVRFPGVPGVLVVDSVQTARAAGTDNAKDPRARAGAVMAALKAAARGGHLVIGTSEVSRGAYSSRNPAESVSDLAAFKESGALEYGAHLALVLRSVADETGLVDVSTAKNRWGSGGERPTFRLALNFRTATFTETAAPAAGEERLSSASSQLERDMDAVRAVLRETADTGVAGYDRLRGALTGMSMTRRRAAVQALRDADEVEDRGRSGQPRLFLRGGLPGSTGSTVDMEPNPPTALLLPLGSRAVGVGHDLGQGLDGSPVDPGGVS